MIFKAKLSPLNWLALVAALILCNNSNVAAQTAQDVVLYASKATVKAGGWKTTADPSAAGGALLVHPNAGAAKISPPLADPTHYFELSFYAVAKTPYRLWLRGKAERDHYNNDSVYVQFSDTVSATTGAAVYRLGTASATSVILEEDGGRGVSGWGWQDNAYGVDAEPRLIHFASTGRKTIRIQTREDGFAIDQILLSPANYLHFSPGAPKNDGVILPQSSGLSDALRLKIVTWNICFGEGTDYVTDLERTATTIFNQQPDIVILNEAINDQAKQLETLLERKTGVTWHGHEFGTSQSRFKNAILSRYAFVSKSGAFLSYKRTVAQGIINAGGRNISLFSTHLDNDSSSERRTQAAELLDYVNNFPEPRIMGGDFNAGYTATEVESVTKYFYDAWRQAVGAKTARAYPDNPVSLSTRTRRSRIDYIFYSRGAQNITLTGAQVPDLRDLSNTNVRVKLSTDDDKGVRPSDHNLVSATLELR